MIDALYNGLVGIFVWPAFGFMLIGIVVGFVVGLLPGLGGGVSLALMLPFIFTMQPIEAFAFLLGMYSVTATTGDITSVLFGVPGEGSAAATILDGHPMAKKGQAGRALGAVLMSSLVGAVFGALALALAVPILRPLVLTFAAPELLLLTILGVTFIATLGGGSMLKGVLMGGFGFLLSMVGTDAQTGVLRYTFGRLYLWEGLPLVPVVIGLFAIPETIDLAVKRTSIAETNPGKLGGVLEGVKDTFRHWWLVMRCSAIGTFIGILPGLGGSVAQWVAYSHAVQSSVDKERFGKGAIEGVLGTGAANNSREGGSLIPTVAFGVPGSPGMAILLGAFLITGLVPGPDMLTIHLDVTFSMVWVMVVSNIITVLVCLLFIDHLAKITFVRGTLLVPFILMMVWLGSFASNNSHGDLVSAATFGVLGWAMVKLDWPRPPFLLGLVLGGLTERYLHITTTGYGANWVTRPVVLVVLLICVLVLLYPFWQARGKRRDQKEPPAVSKWEVLFSGLLVLAFAWGGIATWDWPLNAKQFPLAVIIPMLPLAFTQLALMFRRSDWWAGSPSHEPDSEVISAQALEPEPELPAAVVFSRTLNIYAWIFGSFLTILLLGFPITLPLLVFLYLKFESHENWPLTLVLTAAAWGFIYGLFDRMLHLPWPDGLLFSWLGF